MKDLGILILSFIPISAIILLFIFIIYKYYFTQQEALTTMDAGNILPVLYDSSLTNKNKITDLLGIPVDDNYYNELLNSSSKDPDEVIASIKTYIGSSVSFKDPPATSTTTSTTTTSTDSKNKSTTSNDSKNESTTTSTPVENELPKRLSFKERILQNEK